MAVNYSGVWVGGKLHTVILLSSFVVNFIVIPPLMLFFYHFCLQTSTTIPISSSHRLRQLIPSSAVHLVGIKQEKSNPVFFYFMFYAASSVVLFVYLCVCECLQLKLSATLFSSENDVSLKK